MGSTLRGRADELRRLLEVLAQVGSGRGSIGLVEGPGGIGKTSVLETLIGAAQEAGIRVLFGQAEELDADRPFHALRGAFVNAALDDVIADALDASGAGAEARHRAVDVIVDGLEAHSVDGPMLLCVDDLQWADPGTLLALAALGRRDELPIGLVGARRPLPRTRELDRFLRWAEARAVMVRLDALDDAAVAEIGHDLLGAAMGPSLSEQVGRAGGNPFLVCEMLRLLDEGDGIRREGSMAELAGHVHPSDTHSVLLHRLAALDSDETETLRWAAVLGNRFTGQQLADVSGAGAQGAIRIRSLVSHDVLVDGGDGLTFRHDLIREAVYRDMGAEECRLRHLQAARILAETGAAPLDVAHHLLRGPINRDPDGAQRLVAAARDPMLDARTRSDLLARALELDPHLPDPVSVVLSLAFHLHLQERIAEAVPHVRRLLGTALSDTERVALIESLVSAASTSGDLATAETWCAQGLPTARRLQDSDEPYDRLLASRFFFHAGDISRAAEIAAATADALVDGAGTTTDASSPGPGDASPLTARGGPAAEAANQASYLHTLMGRPSEGLRWAERALARTSSLWIRCVYQRHLGWALGDLDRLDQAMEVLDLARVGAEEQGMISTLAEIQVELARLHYWTGCFEAALVESEVSVAASASVSLDAHRDPALVAAWIAHRRGDDGGAAKLLAENGRPTTYVAPHIVLEGVLAARSGQSDAGDRLAEALARISRIPSVDRRTFDLLPIVARTARAIGRTDLAADSVRSAEKMAADGDAAGIALALARCRTLAVEDADAARRAVELARATPRALLAADALVDAAEVLTRSSAELLDEAAGVYERCGASGDLARIRSSAPAAATGGRERTLTGWTSLTPAEREVVRLAAEGLTNKEIGARLFVSHRTVATHLSHVYDKVGLRSRVELARQAPSHL